MLQDVPSGTFSLSSAICDHLLLVPSLPKCVKLGLDVNNCKMPKPRFGRVRVVQQDAEERAAFEAALAKADVFLATDIWATPAMELLLTSTRRVETAVFLDCAPPLSSVTRLDGIPVTAARCPISLYARPARVYWRLKVVLWSLTEMMLEPS